MSNPRRLSGSLTPSRPSSEDDHQSTMSSLPTPTGSLSPPRPFFLAGRSSERGSWSAASSHDTDPASDSDREQPSPVIPARSPPRQTTFPNPTRPRPTRTHHNHNRRRSSMAASTTSTAYAQIDLDSPPPTAVPNPFNTPSGSENNHSASNGSIAQTPQSLYQDGSLPSTPNTALIPVMSSRPPPSSFTFPFQAYPGNPDPGTSIPGLGRSSRRSSLESISMLQRGPSIAMSETSYQSLPYGAHSATDLNRSYAPFRAASDTPTPGSHSRSSSNAIYKASAAAAVSSPALTEANPNNSASLPRNSSATFRAPFLSPASRPSSSLWSPPSYNHNLTSPNNPHGTDQSPSASSSALALAFPKSKPPLPSTRLASKLAKEDKPWLNEKDSRGRLSWWLTFICMVLGLGGAAILCWSGFSSVVQLKDSQLCSVLNENFDSLDLTNTWTRDVELGGFGNGEFQMTTDSSTNSYIQNSQLYILPTLTSDSIGTAAVLNGGTYNLDGCSTTNKTACSASSSSSRGTVINPVMSARLTTQGKKSIKYGKVEVRAKLPRGDWLWPAIWMLPENNTYGGWPLSGEIDIMEARGNAPSYPAQGSNYVRSTLNYGPLPSLITQIFGWYSLKRSSFDKGFHTYGMEWDDTFMRFYTDSKLNAMLDLRTRNAKESFWGRGGFPQTAQNGSAEVVVQDPWEGRGNSAPYDQPFYLIIDLAAGGTSGWFPDNKGNKPWYDGSLTAMRDFALQQSTWYSTWPESFDDRAFRIDSVKMWQLC